MSREAVLISIPTIIKAVADDTGRRLVSVEASNEVLDGEGDIILQSALMGSAASFVKTGHIDIDHISELGDRLGVPDPMSFIIGRPLEVKDLGDKRTGVIIEIFRSHDGTVDPKKNRYDSFWESLHTDPPVKWRSSIYGFPIDGQIEDHRDKGGKTRFIVKGIDWRSLAMTRNPVNTAIEGYAKIVTAKAAIAEIRKAGTYGVGYGSGTEGLYDTQPAPNVSGAPYACSMAVPRNMDEMIGQYERHIGRDCQHSGGVDTRAGFKSHFELCCGADPYTADILSHALMYHRLLQKKRSA